MFKLDTSWKSPATKGVIGNNGASFKVIFTIPSAWKVGSGTKDKAKILLITEELFFNSIFKHSFNLFLPFFPG